MSYLYSKIRFFFLFLPGLFLFLSCHDQEDYIPYVPVSKFIYLNDPDFIALQPIGNYVILPNEGYGGIIVYHKAQYEYQAFDRACTWEADQDCVVSEQGTSGVVTCSCCQSEFYLILDGQVKEGPARRPLKQYQVSYDPVQERLYISN